MTDLHDEWDDEWDDGSWDAPESEPRPTGGRFLVRAIQLLALVVLALAISAGAAYLSTRDDGSSQAGTGLDSEGSDLSVVGPSLSRGVASYIAARSVSLESVEGDVIAVVSFNSYLTKDQASEILADLEPTRYLVAVPGSGPEIVSDVDGWLADRVADAREERENFEELIPTIDQPDFLEDALASVRELTELEEALTNDGPGAVGFVFAVVVEADADRLRALALVDRVRLVDAEVADTVASSAQFRGLRPEETVSVGNPIVRQ